MEFVSSICGFWAQRAAHGLCALCLLTTPEISSTGPVRVRGFCPRPVSGVDLGLFVLRLPSDPSLEPVGDVAEGFVRVL